MIYFDNASTSKNKPIEVINAFNYYISEVGVSPGRGSYSLGIQASRMLYQSRKTVAQFFGSLNPENIVFTKNSTEAINLYFNGFLKKGDHVLISAYEHNSVLRPIHSLKEKGIIDYTILPDEAIYNPEQFLKNYIKKNTVIIAVTLASNLTGQIVFNPLISKVAHRHNLVVFVDASQGGGKKLVNMQNDNVDVIAFTGHKDLLALPGVGGLCSKNSFEISPLIQGGTGIHGDEYINPKAYPEAYEAGTLNMPAIWSLKNSMDYINEHFDEIKSKEKKLLEMLIGHLKSDAAFQLYNVQYDRVPTFCFNLKNVVSSEVVKYLDGQGVCVRGGIHCAILAHEHIGTVKNGAVRVSINASNTEEEVIEFINIIGEMKNAFGVL